MPLYEYECRQCGDLFELLIRGSESPQCPQCNSDSVEKQLSAPAAPQGASRELPVCTPPAAGGCGLQQCGTGGCAMD